MHEFRADQSMTTEEAEAVVRRFQEGAHGGGSTHVSDVAEALGTSPEVVARLLSEVRQSPATVEVVEPVPQKRRVRRPVLAYAALAAGLLLGAITLTNLASAPKSITVAPAARASDWTYATPVPSENKETARDVPKGPTEVPKGP